MTSAKDYEVCKECDSGVILHQAGFEIELHACAICNRMVSDKDEFFLPSEILSKD